MAVHGHGGCLCRCGNGYKLHVSERHDNLREELWQGKSQRFGDGHAGCVIWSEWDVAESGRKSFLRPQRGREERGRGCIPLLSLPGGSTLCRGPRGRGRVMGCRGGRID